MVECETGGDPLSTKKWVRSSLRQLSASLDKLGFRAGYVTVGRLLKELGFSLKVNHKRFTGSPHPDRDRQFRYIERVTWLFRAAGHPIISVDSKKKELIGNFKNPGRTWCREAEEVNVYDFPQDALGQAIPYGIYDLQHNLGYVAVGTSADTSEFAVDAIAWWWELEGRPTFADETKLLILSDAGGSDGCRFRLWKQQLQEQLADRLGIAVMVCHYPTGASKWNPIEHRLFSAISNNWEGVPLDSYETILKYMRKTKTTPKHGNGLKVKATLVRKRYCNGQKVSDKEMAQLKLEKHDILPKWNYTLSPTKM